MLTPLQKELLLQGEREIKDRLRKDLRLSEKLIFEAFYRTLPGFAGREIEWKLGPNPPDILCFDDAGRQIGVELVEWLNEAQIKASKIREKSEQSFLQVIRSQDISPPSNIGLVWLSSKLLVPLREADAEKFRLELFALIESENLKWEINLDQQTAGSYFYQDFSNYPYLKRYLASIQFFSRARFNTSRGARWIRFPTPTFAYSPEESIDSLIESIKKKTSKYIDLHRQESLDELYLLVYYDQGWFYNTPFNAPGVDFSNIAERVAQFVATDHGIFQKIFLFNSLYGNQEAIQLWPGE